MTEEGSLKDELRDIKRILASKDDDKRRKGFKMPWKGKVSPARAAKGYVTVIKINENGFLDFKKEKIDEQTIMVDGIPRLASPDYVLHWKKNPVVILPSWSVKPFSPEDNQQKSLNDGSNTKGYKILMAKMKSETIKKGTEIAGWIKWVAGIGLVVIVGYVILTGFNKGG